MYTTEQLTHQERTRGLDAFLKRIFNRKYQVVWTVVLGPNQSGKTDFNLFMMERLHALGLYDGFGANMPIDAPFKVDFIEDYETLEHTCKMLNPNPEKHGIKRYLFLGSEMGTWLPKDQPWENVKFIKKLQQVRKYGLSWLGDGIDRIDSRVVNPSHFHGYFQKIAKKNPMLAIYHDWADGRKIRLKNIPRTTLGFNTWYSAMFYMEPQLKEGAVLPLNEEHELVKQYLECGSWKALGIHSQEGKRLIAKVLGFHYTHCLHSLSDEAKPTDDSSSSE
jgi:hypothetical protein